MWDFRTVSSSLEIKSELILFLFEVMVDGAEDVGALTCVSPFLSLPFPSFSLLSLTFSLLSPTILFLSSFPLSPCDILHGQQQT